MWRRRSGILVELVLAHLALCDGLWLAARDRHKALGVGGTLSGHNEACVGVELLYDSMYLRAARSALSFALAMNSLPPFPPS